MGNERKEIKIKQIIETSPHDIYTAFTSPVGLQEWLCSGAEAAAHEAGRLYLWWDHGYYATGEFTGLEPDKKIAFTWHGRNEPGQSLVKVTLKPKENGTQVSLVHSGFDRSKAWRNSMREIQHGWKRGLDNLKSVLETGIDLRTTNRPVLGISELEVLSPEKAQKLGLGKAGRLLIGSVVEGFGAAEAGLQKGDVLLRLGKQKVNSLAELRSVLGEHSAGDALKITFWRDGEKQSCTLVLSGQKLPEVPKKAGELGQMLDGLFMPLQAQLKDILQGATEQSAGINPVPGEWNTKDILAHLILTERELHVWIGSLIEGQEANVFSNHDPARLQAVQLAHPTPEQLLSELYRAQAETVGLVNSLPQELVSRKGSFWRIGIYLLSLPEHMADHARQIEAALKSASEALTVSGEVERSQDVDLPQEAGQELQADKEPQPPDSPVESTSEEVVTAGSESQATRKSTRKKKTAGQPEPNE